MLKLLRRILFLGLLAAAVYALWKRFAGADNGNAADFGLPIQLPVPSVPGPAVVPSMPPAVPAPTASVIGTPTETTAPPEPAIAAPAATAWVEAIDGACPLSHPVKGKRTSGIFHVPGGQNYDRTRADRCYTDGNAAESDGLRQAKR